MWWKSVCAQLKWRFRIIKLEPGSFEYSMRIQLRSWMLKHIRVARSQRHFFRPPPSKGWEMCILPTTVPSRGAQNMWKDNSRLMCFIRFKNSQAAAAVSPTSRAPAKLPAQRLSQILPSTASGYRTYTKEVWASVADGVPASPRHWEENEKQGEKGGGDGEKWGKIERVAEGGCIAVAGAV